MRPGLVCLLCLVTATSGAVAPGSGDPAPAVAHAERAARPLPRPLPFFYDLYTFRGNEGRTDVVAAFAVPVDRLDREHMDSDVRYRFDVSLVLADTAVRSVYRTADSMFVSVPRPLSGRRLLYTQVHVQAPPSQSTIQRVIMTDATSPGIGQLYTSPFPIPDYSGSQLMISDIALGLPDAEGGWKRGDASLALLPTSQFPGSAFDLYYEVYNLPKNDRYSTEIAVEPLDRGDRGEAGEDRTVRARFAGQSTTSPAGVMSELRRVDASLAPGRYRLTVTVSDDNIRASVSRSRDFEVRGSSKGETLVKAQPYRNTGTLF